MKNQDASSFRFRMTDDSPGHHLPEELESRRSKRSGKRATWLAILISLIVGAAAVWGYVDLKKGVNTLRQSDVIEVQKLSEDLNSKFSSLSIQYAKLEESVNTLQESFKGFGESFDKKVLSLDEIFIVFEKTTSSLKNDLKKTQQTLNELNVTKSDKKELSAVLDKFEKQVTPIDQRLKDMETRIKDLDENLTQELAEVSGTLQKVKVELNKFEKIQQEVTTLSTSKLDQKGLENELKDQEDRLQKDLRRFRQELDKKDENIKDMQDQIQELMKFKALSEIKKRIQPLESTSPAKESPQPSPAEPQSTEKQPAPTEQTLPPLEPGAIIEQNIQ
jgi:DNA repair exonuclease SbcCD ATPase subunit